MNQVEYFVTITMEGNTIDHVLAIKIPESSMNDLYKAEKISFDIIKKTLHETTVLNKKSDICRIHLRETN